MSLRGAAEKFQRSYAEATGVTDRLSANAFSRLVKAPGEGEEHRLAVATTAADSPPQDAGTQAPPTSSPSPAICFSILELIIALDLQRHSKTLK